MNDAKIFNVPAGSFRPSRQGDLEESARRTLDAMATDIVKRALKAPLLIYVCSGDDEREIRNFLALALARLIRGRVPETMLIDGDYLQPGLSGIVPTPDAMGFLDQILYGSSLAAITQRLEDGLAVVGAGSFPSVKRTPFLMDAFVDSARYLITVADCVILSGPRVGDDGGVHPLVGVVDIPILVGEEEIGDFESRMAAAAAEQMWSVRVKAPAEVTISEPDEEGVRDLRAGVDEVLQGGHPKPPPARVDGAEAPAGDALEVDIDAVIAVPFDEEGPEEALGGRSWNSAVPKIVTSALAVFLVGFLLWFLYLTKSLREDGDQPVDIAEVTTGGPDLEMSGALTDTLGAKTAPPSDSIEVAAAPDTASSAQGLQRRPNGDPDRVVDGETKAIADTATRQAEKRPEPAVETPPPKRDRTPLPPELAAYSGKYLVHVSSFRGIRRAKDDAQYLEGRGYPTIIARIDLGEKGLWYRVYVGPFASRVEALNRKIMLDENPRVLSTRITRVPIAQQNG